MQATDTEQTARLAGWAYLAIIVVGVTAEAVLRAGILVPDDPARTAANITAEAFRFHLSMLFDAVMILCDVALAVLLYRFFRPVDATLAMAAMVFRLVQAAVLAGNLMTLQLALMLGSADAGLAHVFLVAHGIGYDIGLLFFGVNMVLTANLLCRSNLTHQVLSMGLALSGLVYLTGSILRLLAPDLSAAFAPAYAMPLVAESLFCLWLLAFGYRRTTLA
jgi:hypothetical protein